MKQLYFLTIMFHIVSGLSFMAYRYDHDRNNTQPSSFLALLSHERILVLLMLSGFGLGFFQLFWVPRSDQGLVFLYNLIPAAFAIVGSILHFSRLVCLFRPQDTWAEWVKQTHQFLFQYYRGVAVLSWVVAGVHFLLPDIIFL
jgi:hypothetical protein